MIIWYHFLGYNIFISICRHSLQILEDWNFSLANGFRWTKNPKLWSSFAMVMPWNAASPWAVSSLYSIHFTPQNPCLIESWQWVLMVKFRYCNEACERRLCSLWHGLPRPWKISWIGSIYTELWWYNQWLQWSFHKYMWWVYIFFVPL